MKRDTLPTYGGQAVIEGVMMRGRDAMALAMRAPDRSIVIHKENLAGIYKTNIARIPFLRGIVMLWDALGLGMRALTISANLQTDEKERIEGSKLAFTMIIALVFAVGLFFVLPASIGHLTEQISLPANAIFAEVGAPELLAGPNSDADADPEGRQISGNPASWTGNLVEGLARLTILIAYIWFVGKVPDIRRVFAYHGAEHKTINAYEAGAELTPDNVKRFSLEHPRCGTAFLLTLVLLSIIIFTLIGPLPLGWRLVSRVVMIPILAGVAYEYIRWTARHIKSPLVKLLVKPNLALQRLTTREPDLDMLEVSIAAFNAMRSSENSLAL